MDEKVVTIEKIVFGGKGLSRDLSKVTFVPYTLPGEKVRVRIVKEHRDYLEAEAVEIVNPAKERVSPDCRYFGDCGGCQMSHTSYDHQLQLKKTVLEETLRRNRIEMPALELIPSEPWHYRHRARFKFDPHRRKLGFYQTDTNTVVDIQECLCLTPGLNRLLKRLRAVLLLEHVPGLKEIECFENDRGHRAVSFNMALPAALHRAIEQEATILGPEEIDSVTIAVRGHSFPVHPSIFLQVNPGMWKAMIQELESHYVESGNETALELYCGAGFFTLPLSAKFGRVIACEENPAAIRFAKENHRVETIEWVCEKAEQLQFPENATALLVDPPRSGLTRKVLEKVMAHSFRKISYVSCNCASFARDVKLLSSRYRLSQLTLLDLFPQTSHFETIALLTAEAQGKNP